jgi:hypothetical protein
MKEKNKVKYCHKRSDQQKVNENVHQSLTLKYFPLLEGQESRRDEELGKMKQFKEIIH